VKTTVLMKVREDLEFVENALFRYRGEDSQRAFLDGQARALRVCEDFLLKFGQLAPQVVNKKLYDLLEVNMATKRRLLHIFRGMYKRGKQMPAEEAPAVLTMKGHVNALERVITSILSAQEVTV
jgi:hypothetical protein